MWIEDGSGGFLLFRRRNCAVRGCGRSSLDGFGMQWDLLELGIILGLHIIDGSRDSGPPPLSAPRIFKQFHR